jgi:2'-5' RNA ligase
MRLFVAIDPPTDAVDHLRAHVNMSQSGLRWVKPEQWHLTLTFCGDVEERKADDLSTRLARAAARHKPLQLQLAGAGAFSRPARAHALWIGLAGDVDALSTLAASTSAAARRVGVKDEDRRYRPHLTIARASPPSDLRDLVTELSSYQGPPWTATDIHLVRSHLAPSTVHERIGTWPLSG